MKGSPYKTRLSPFGLLLLPQAELDKQTRKHTEPGLVSLIVREKEER